MVIMFTWNCLSNFLRKKGVFKSELLNVLRNLYILFIVASLPNVGMDWFSWTPLATCDLLSHLPTNFMWGDIKWLFCLFLGQVNC